MPLPITSIRTRLATASTTTFARTLEKTDQIAGNRFATEAVVVDTIIGDPMLTGALIGYHHSLGGKPDSTLADAVRQQGLGGVQQIVRSAMAVPDSHRKALATCYAQANATSAMLPLVIARHRGAFGRSLPGTAVLRMIGLLHDLGHSLALLHFTKEYAKACVRLQQEETPFDELIRQEVGAGCGELGAIQAELWQLPPAFASTMRWFRRPMASPDDVLLASAVHISHILVQAIGFTAGGDRFVEPLDDGVITLVGLTVGDVQAILEEFQQEMDEIEMLEAGLTA